MLRTPNGDADYVLSVVEDITARAAAQRALQRRAAQLSLLNDVGRQIASAHMVDEVLNRAAQLIHRELGYHHVGIFTIDAGSGELAMRARAGGFTHLFAPDHRLSPGQGMVGWVAQHGQSLLANDVSAEPRYVNLYGDALPTRSELTVPIKIGERVLGVLDVQSPQRDAFMPEDRQVQETLADQIAVALSNAQQFKQTQAALEQASMLYNASQSIALAEEPQTMLTELIKYAAADADGATIILHERAQSGSAEPRLEAVATWARQASDKQVAPGTHFTMEQLPIMRSLSPDQPIIIEDANAPDVDPGLRRAMNLLNVRAAVVLPMVTGQHPFGALIIAYREPRSLPLDNLRPLIALTNQLAVSVQNQQLLAETHLTLEQLNEANRRLTGEAWRAYTRAAARPLRVIDAGPGVVPEQLPPTAEAAVPIVVRGEAIGHLKLRDTDRRASWSEADLALLQAVAAEVAGVIDNARLFEQAQDRAAREAQLNRIADRIRRASGIQAILRAAAEELSVALDTSHAHAQLSRAVGQADGREPTGER